MRDATMTFRSSPACDCHHSARVLEHSTTGRNDIIVQGESASSRSSSRACRHVPSSSSRSEAKLGRSEELGVRGSVSGNGLIRKSSKIFAEIESSLQETSKELRTFTYLLQSSCTCQRRSCNAAPIH